MLVNWKKNITLLFISQAVTLFGSSLVQYAITWYITLTTGSGVMMTFAILCGFLPTFFISPFGGVWADRYNRKYLINIADGSIAFFTFILVLLFINGHTSFFFLFVITALRAVGSGIQQPALNALIPQLVPEKHLTRVNSINGTLQWTIQLISPMVSALLMANFSITQIFMVDVVTAVIGITLFLSFVKVPSTKHADIEKSHYLKDLIEGLKYVRNQVFLKHYFRYSLALYAIIAPAAFLTPLQAKRSFHGNEFHLSIMEMGFSAGMIVGGLILTAWGGFKNRLNSLVTATVVWGLCNIGLGLTPYFSIFVILMIIYGLVMPLYTVSSTVMLQEKVESAYMGRVFGIYTMLASSVMPLTMLFYGPLADVVAIELLLLVTGTLFLILGVLLAGDKPLRQAGLKKNYDETTDTLINIK